MLVHLASSSKYLVVSLVFGNGCDGGAICLMMWTWTCEGGTEDLEFCDELLGKVSRSFAAVIRQLPHGLCVEITVFYLALRALDTIEDDMEAFAHDPTIKVRHLQNFYEEGLEDQTFSMTGVGKVCMVSYP